MSIIAFIEFYKFLYGTTETEQDFETHPNLQLVLKVRTVLGSMLSNFVVGPKSLKNLFIDFEVMFY